MSIKVRIAATIVGGIFLVSLVIFGIYEYRLGVLSKTVHDQSYSSVLEGEQDALKDLVTVALNITKEIHDRKQRAADKQTLQDEAKKLIQQMRTDSGNYFWITDMNSRMVMHPIKTNLVGKDMSGTKDSAGKALFSEMVKVCATSGSGFVSYRWPKPGSSTPLPKLSYVALFEPWDWVIGIGEYIDDVEAKASKEASIINKSIDDARASALLWGILSAVILTAGAIFLVQSNLIAPLLRLVEFSSEVAKGRLDSPLDGAYPGELSSLKNSMLDMVKEIKTRIGYAEGVLEGVSSSYPFISVDKEAKVTRLNYILLQVLGKTGKPEDYAGMEVGDFFHGDPSRPTRTSEALNQQKRIDHEMTITTTDGSEKILNVNATPLYDLDGELIGAFTTYFDLTEIRRQEKEIKEKTESIFEIARESRKIASQVSDGAAQVTEQIRSCNQGAQMQQERSTETATAMEQMNASVTDVARSASDVAMQAAETQEKSAAGAQSVSQLIRQIGNASTTITELSSRVVVLGEQTTDIGRVMDMINDIADQTNLLALNAAIEAARAGEAGRGFAVVADEVRKLAEKTMDATKEVGQVITTIQQSSRVVAEDMQGVTSVVGDISTSANDSGSALEHIQNLAASTNSQVQSIAAATEEQSAASEQVTRSMNEVSQIAEDTTDLMREAMALVDGVAHQVDHLAGIISQIEQQGGA